MRRVMGGVPLPIWILLLILGLAAVMLTLSQSNAEARPSAGSAMPSGLRIFAKLATEAGFEVTSTRDPAPILEAGDVPVVIEMEFPSTAWFEGMTAERQAETIRKPVRKHIEGGGTAVLSRLRQDFRIASIGVRDRSDSITDGPQQLGVVTSRANDNLPDLSEGKVTEVWMRNQFGRFVWISRLGQGRAVLLDDALPLTNRFITEHENAALVMGMLRGLVPAKSRLVFMEAAWGNLREPSLVEQIGPWAAAAWTQFVVLLLVIAYTLGRGFGLPNAARPKQSGQRDLVEASASFFRRAQATDIALSAELADARHKILSELKLPRGTEWSVWSLRVPERLQQVYREVEMAAKDRVRTSDAIRLARDLDAEVTAFVGEKRLATRRRLRRSGTSRSRF